jgi:glutamate synthase (NADPH/NADH) small chain
MEEEGVVFQCNAEVGVNVSVNDLLRQFNAVVLAGGSTIPRDLPVPGRDLKGVHFAMDFLTQQNKRISQSLDKNEEPILAKDKHVVIIGGGDTGSDCVGTSNRQEAKSITQFELLPKPPESRTIQMPWPTYPMVLKISSSHEEGCERQWAVNTKEFIGDGNGNLKALKIVDLEWKIGENGKAQFVEIEDSAREIPCDLALLAMGFVHPQHEGLINDLAVELDERGNVRANERLYQTNIQKIFTAGDMRRGQSLVVWAISEGRECARKVDEFLMGHSVLETRDENLIAI